MPISFNAIRVGKKYYLINYSERFEFEVLSRLYNDNFLLKDLNSLETYHLFDLVKYGKGSDYDIDELDRY
jgi:hypothetical protein